MCRSGTRCINLMTVQDHTGNALNEALLTNFAIREELALLLKSKPLAASPTLRALLSFIVTRTLEGNAATLKEYSLGVEVFRRPASYDPRLDPVVRVQASNLRTKLRDYYAGSGAGDPVVIELPRGSYVPRFTAGHGNANEPHRPIEPASIAVLPCADLSASRDHGPFCEGLTEEIINALGKLDGIKVVGRASVFRFKEPGQVVCAVGKELGVQAILEISLRSDKDLLRITAHLTEAATGFITWSRIFSFRITDTFATQEEIASSIVSALPVTGAGNGRLTAWSSLDPEAYNRYLLARFHMSRRTEGSLRRSLSLFSGLLQSNPLNPPVLAGLGECHFLLAMSGAEPPSAAMTKAASLASRALQLESGLPDAHATLASVKALYEWDWSAADRGFARALDLQPNHSEARAFYAFAYLLPMGFRQEAVDLMQMVVERDPLSVPANQMLAFASYALRRYEDAIRQCERTLDLEEYLPRAHALRALALAYAGSYSKAMAAAQHALELEGGAFVTAIVTAAVTVNSLAGQRRRAAELLKASSKRFGPDSAHWYALAWAVLGEKERAMRLLRIAFRRRDPWLVSMVYDPLADPLRSDQRFQKLVSRFGLAAGSAQLPKSA